MTSCRLFSIKISARNNLDLKSDVKMTPKRRSILLVILLHVFWIKTIGAVLILFAGHFVVLYTMFWIEVKVFFKSLIRNGLKKTKN